MNYATLFVSPTALRNDGKWIETSKATAAIFPRRILRLRESSSAIEANLRNLKARCIQRRILPLFSTVPLLILPLRIKFTP